jgi:hypothetical protein
MDITFVFYVIISIIVISGSMYYNSTPGSMSKAVIMAILFLLVSIYFGTRWFTTSGASNIGTNHVTTWPPPNSINMCPDYTTLSSSGGQYPVWTCTDTIGISTVGPGQKVALNANPSSTNPGYYGISDLCKDCYEKGLTWEGVCVPNSSNPINVTANPPRPA